jgi:ribosomal 50S subunit-associated protein YjgA (DUF615 family)
MQHMQHTKIVDRSKTRRIEKTKNKRHERATRRALAYLSSRLSDIDLEAFVAFVESKNR